jgi:SAM-dependent methyltransferase
MTEALRRIAWRARMRLPAPVKTVLRRLAELVDPLVVAYWRRRHSHPDPLPPRSLRASVGGAPIRMYVENGRHNVAGLTAALAKAGWRLEDVRRVLDFGCGCGRTLQSFPRVPGQEVHGCDVNEPAVRWAREHIPWARFEHTGFQPPLPYPDDRFDLVFAVSVFTHLSEQSQHEWLAELARVTRPGGVALLSILGEGARLYDWTQMGPGHAYGTHINETLAADGAPFVFIRFADAAHAPGMDADERAHYGMTFHTEQYVRERWSGPWEVVDLVPGAIAALQDVAVLRAAG